MKRRLQHVAAFPWLRDNLPLFVLIVSLIFAIPFALFVLLGVLGGRDDQALPPTTIVGMVILLVSVGFAVIYGAAGVLVRTSRAGARIDGAELESPCLMVSGVVQSPATAFLKDRRLWLVPAIGKPQTVDLDAVTAEEVPGRFNGSLYPGQSAFWLHGRSVAWRLGFMPDAPDKWRARLPLSQESDGD